MAATSGLVVSETGLTRVSLNDSESLRRSQITPDMAMERLRILAAPQLNSGDLGFKPASGRFQKWGTTLISLKITQERGGCADLWLKRPTLSPRSDFERDQLRLVFENGSQERPFVRIIREAVDLEYADGRDKDTFGSFGGEKREGETPIETAKRTSDRQALGVLTVSLPPGTRIASNPCSVWDDYHLFFVEIPADQRTYYSAFDDALNQMSSWDTEGKKKSEIAWVNAREVFRAANSPDRDIKIPKKWQAKKLQHSFAQIISKGVDEAGSNVFAKVMRLS